MADSYDQSDIPRLIREEHLALRTAGRWLLSFLDESGADTLLGERRVALQAFLDALRTELGVHFNHEEVAARSLWAGIEKTRREQLWKEHALLLAWVEELLAALGDEQGSPGSSQSALLERFLALLGQHEAAERRAFSL